MTIHSVFFFANGNVAVCDDTGNQVPELQESYLLSFVTKLEAAGFDPTHPIYHLPAGDARVVRTSAGYNWQFISEGAVTP